MKSPSLLQRLRRVLWFATAGTVILVAVALTLTRLLLPNLQSYRTDVERKASEFIGQPVRIGTLDVHLLGLAPTVILKDVRLLDRRGAHTVAHFREARIGIDVLASLRRHRAVMSELTVVGAELTLLRLRDGRLRVQGLAGKGGANGAPDAEGIGRWLLGQGRLTLFDSRVRWRDLKSGRSFVMRRVDIDLRNNGNRHQLNVDVQLPPGVGRGLHLAFDLTGDVLKPDGWSGIGYVQADGILPALFGPAKIPGTALSVVHGRLDLRLWGLWTSGQIFDVAGDIAADHALLRRGHQELAFTHASTTLHWQLKPAGWTLDLGDLEFQQGTAPASPEQWRVSGGHGGWFVRASAVDLADIAAIAPFVPALDARQQADIAALRPHGTVRQFRLDLPAQGTPHVQGEFDGLGVAPLGRIPGVANLSGRFAWSGDRGQLLLDAHGVAVDADRLFRAPLTLRQLQADIHIRHGDEGWRVTARQVSVANADVQAALSATMTLPPRGSPYLDLRGSFANAQAAAVTRYVPAHIMDPDAVAWLDRAFGAGTASGDVLFHGPLAAFPFDHGQGRFAVRFQVRNADLLFRDGWPRIREINAQAAFVDRGVDIEADSGAMFGSQIQHASVRIADLERPLLTVRGVARLPGDDGLRLLRDTPLHGRFGGYVSGLKLGGITTLNLALDVPLAKRVEAAHPLTVNGALQLQDNRLQVGERFSVDAVTGTLHFDDHGLSARKITAQILGQPSTLSVRTRGHGAAAYTVIHGSGRLDVSALARQDAKPLQTRLTGSTTWYGSLIVPHGGGAELHVVSALRGVAVILPAPLGKAAGGQRRFELTRYFSGQRRGQLAASYGDSASLLLLLNGDGAVTRGTLRLGTGRAHLPKHNVLRISGSLREFEPSLWSGIVPSGAGGLPLPLRVDMDTLHIAGGKGLGSGKLSWRSLPTLDVAIRHFGFGKYRFGRLAFHLEHGKDDLQLRDLLFAGQAFKLTGQARWQWRPRSYSEVKLHLNSGDVGALAREFHVASVITSGKLNSSGDFHWPGPLTYADLRQLGGHIHMKIEDGRMENVDPGAGRLLGLFSLQALPQHLTLDFRDLFQKGLVFTSFAGDTTLRGGNAYTSNLVMTAPSATIRIEGRTGLVKRDFDQLITVVPNVSGSAPVVGALAFGPQVGAALFLLEKLFGKKVDQAVKTQYKVTGSWDKPRFTRLQPEKKNAQHSRR